MQLINAIELTNGNERIELFEYKNTNVAPTRNLDNLYHFVLTHYTDGVKVFSDKLGYYEGKEFIESLTEVHGYEMTRNLNDEVETLIEA